MIVLLNSQMYNTAIIEGSTKGISSDGGLAVGALHYVSTKGNPSTSFFRLLTCSLESDLQLVPQGK